MATTRPRLGELLQAQGLCTREQLREAWEAKVLYGDRLGTNLLALGHIDEPALARVLGEQLGVHSGHGKVIQPEPPAVALVPKTIAEKRFVVPHHVVDRQLFLLMRDPNDAVAIDEVRFSTSLKVVPVVVCEARIWELLARHYNVHVSMRPVPLDVDLALLRRRGHGGGDEKTSPKSAAPELTSEEDFQRLYAGIHAPGSVLSLDDATGSVSAANAVPVEAPLGGAAPLQPPIGDDDDETGARTMPGTPTAKFVRPLHPANAAGAPASGEAAGVLAPPRAGGDASSWRDTIEKTNPMLALPKFMMVNGEPRLLDDASEDVVELVEVAHESDPDVTQPGMSRPTTLEFHVEVDEAVDESPLTFAQASELLQGARDRNAIARVVLRAARTQFARACLLAVYPDRLVGWMGIGEGMESDRIRAVAVPRSEKSVFGFVVDSRAHYLGPLAKWPAHGAWVKATGRKIPRSLAVFPILVRGRPVNVLVVDNGHDGHVDTDVGGVLILAQQIAKTYETLLSSA